jgi:hypothetical protein
VPLSLPDTLPTLSQVPQVNPQSQVVPLPVPFDLSQRKTGTELKRVLKFPWFTDEQLKEAYAHRTDIWTSDWPFPDSCYAALEQLALVKSQTTNADHTQINSDQPSPKKKKPAEPAPRWPIGQYPLSKRLAAEIYRRCGDDHLALPDLDDFVYKILTHLCSESHHPILARKNGLIIACQELTNSWKNQKGSKYEKLETVPYPEETLKQYRKKDCPTTERGQISRANNILDHWGGTFELLITTFAKNPDRRKQLFRVLSRLQDPLDSAQIWAKACDIANLSGGQRLLLRKAGLHLPPEEGILAWHQKVNQRASLVPSSHIFPFETVVAGQLKTITVHYAKFNVGQLIKVGVLKRIRWGVFTIDDSSCFCLKLSGDGFKRWRVTGKFKPSLFVVFRP